MAATDFAAAIENLGVPQGAPVAVAVSGGPDSMALLHLLATWAKPRGSDLIALTVDHQLRAESTAEADQVGRWCAGMGIPHHILTWADGASRRGLDRSLQADAREARFGLLTAWCRSNRVAHLCLGHHADDQVETFLLRLARGSGVDGLAGMAPRTVRSGVNILRPLLRFAKDQLRATCVDVGQPWIDDPSNGNSAAARVRFRGSRAMLEREGLTWTRLLATMDHLQRARAALSAAVDELLARACAWDTWGAARIDHATLCAAPAEIGLRALARVLIGAGGAAYGPRFDGLERLFDAIRTGPWRDSALHGCLIRRRGAVIEVLREPAAVQEVVPVVGGADTVWDRRFRIVVPASLVGVVVAPLTAADWRVIAQARPELHVPMVVRESLPVVRDSRGLAVAPWAGMVRDDLQHRPEAHKIVCVFVPWLGMDEVALQDVTAM